MQVAGPRSCLCKAELRQSNTCPALSFAQYVMNQGLLPPHPTIPTSPGNVFSPQLPKYKTLIETALD